MTEHKIKEGIININKPAGMTSHDCVSVLRRITGVRRIGHTGTLDPQATGVLPLCIGTAARITEYLDLDFKKYRCSLLLGLDTETLDVWGEVREDCRQQLKEELLSGNGLTEEQIRDAFLPQTGVIDQIPPKYSAIRVNGRRLYQYARAGEEVEIKARTVFIKDLVIEEICLERLEVTFTVTCSKGTYIRSICRDVGDVLGCGAAMSALVRLESGVFTLENAVELNRLEALKSLPEEERVQALNQVILTADFPLIHFGKVVLTPERGRWFCDGGHIGLGEGELQREPIFKEQLTELEIRTEYKQAYNIYKKEEHQEVFLGVAFYNAKYKKLVADKVFAR